MDDNAIIALYWAREERALEETSSKYGSFCRNIAYNILCNREDTEVREGVIVDDNWFIVRRLIVDNDFEKGNPHCVITIKNL